MDEKYNCINKVAVAANSSEQRSGLEFRTLAYYQENPQLPSPAGAAACCRRPLSPRPAAAVRPSTAPSSVARSPPHPHDLASCRRRASCLGLHRSWVSCLVCVSAGSISTGCYWPKCPTAGCVASAHQARLASVGCGQTSQGIYASIDAYVIFFWPRSKVWRPPYPAHWRGPPVVTLSDCWSGKAHGRPNKLLVGKNTP